MYQCIRINDVNRKRLDLIRKGVKLWAFDNSILAKMIILDQCWVGIRGFLVRIRGSVLLTNGSGSGSNTGSDFFLQYFFLIT